MTADAAGQAIAAAQQAARSLGFEATGARLLRQAAATTIELPHDGVVARVEAPGAGSSAHRQVAAARLCERRGVPAARLASGRRQPVEVAGRAVTLWQRLRILDGVPDPGTVGSLTRQLHSRCARDLPVEMPDLDPFKPAARWLERPCAPPPPAGTRRLRQRLDRLRAGWSEAVAHDPLGTTLVHGDLTADNVVLTAEGAMLLDLENAGRGPASWDLVVRETAVRRYGASAGDFRRFCTGYGAGLPDWPGVEALRQAYELHLTLWAVGHRDLSPAMAQEAEVRVAVLLGEHDRPWTLL